MAVHLLVTLALVGIVVNPVVVVFARLVACVKRTVVGVLVAGAKCEVIANGGTHAESELPRGEELEFVFVA